MGLKGVYLFDYQLKEISKLVLKHEDILVGRDSKMGEHVEYKNVDDSIMQSHGVNNSISL